MYTINNRNNLIVLFRYNLVALVGLARILSCSGPLPLLLLLLSCFFLFNENNDSNNSQIKIIL